MNDPSVRKTKRADELVVGDWLAQDESGHEVPSEVLAVFQYPTAAGDRVHLTTRVPGKPPYSSAIPPEVEQELVSEAELAATTAAAERAKKIADLRTFIDFLDRNPWAPLPYLNMQADLERADVWNGGIEGLAELRRIADALGEKPNESLDDRTQVTRRFGSVEYKAITWHKDGRPAEPAPEPDHDGSGVDCRRCASEGFEGVRHDADPLGLAYSRADDEPDDPTPVSPARVPLHTGGVTDGGLVDETSCQGAPAGFEADCGVTGPHGPHGAEPTGDRS